MALIRPCRKRKSCSLKICKYKILPKKQAKKIKGLVEISNFLSYKNTKKIKITKNILDEPNVLKVMASKINPKTKARTNTHSLRTIIEKTNTAINTKGKVVTEASKIKAIKKNINAALIILRLQKLLLFLRNQ